MEPGAREKLQGWLYDDMCHLMPYAGMLTIIQNNTTKYKKKIGPIKQNIFLENAAQKEQSSMAQVFAKLKKAVDKV